jgi:hypothetical protein
VDSSFILLDLFVLLESNERVARLFAFGTGFKVLLDVLIFYFYFVFYNLTLGVLSKAFRTNL